jgi:hypothetical protein
MDIFINNEKIKFTDSDFPILISGAEKTGASFFSVSLLANILNNGYKVLFFSAYQMAKDDFEKQIYSGEDRVIMIDSGEEQDFIDTINKVADLPERVVLIKNIDNYGRKLFDIAKNLKLVIFSGDIDKCQFSNDLMGKDFSTKIFFSQSEKYPQDCLDNLPKYCGKIISPKHNGIINLGLVTPDIFC